MKEEHIYLAFAAIAAMFIILKFGFIVYLLLTAFYYLSYLLILEWNKTYSTHSIYDKLYKWLRGCFFLGNDIWLNREETEIFTALEKYCKTNKLKVSILSEQIEAFSKDFNGNPLDSDVYLNAAEAISRIESMQKSGILRIFHPAPEHKYELPKLQFFEALTYYAKNRCQVTSYLSKDPELRVRVRYFMEENSDTKIDIIPYGDFLSACEYINRFKVTIDFAKIKNAPKKKIAQVTKPIDNVKKRNKELKEFIATIMAARAK